MTPTQTARHFDVREGFDVVDFAEVGLPVFRLTVDAVTLARQEIPTTHEFVLRSIMLGETDCGSIARLLGLPNDAVEDALAVLAYDGCVAVARDDFPADGTSGETVTIPDERYEITDSGLEKLQEGKRLPREEPLVLDFDGIRRRPIMLGSESLRRAKELAERGAVQIRPYPAEPPEVADLPVAAVARAVRRRSGKEFERQVMILRRISRRDSLFRPAVALVYRSRTTSEVQIGFVVGDQLAEDYELAFAKHGGPKKPGLVRDPSTAQSSLDFFLGEHLNLQIAEGEAASRLRSHVTLASRDYAIAAAKLERLRQRPKLRDDESGELTEIERRLGIARDELDRLPLRSIAAYEQPELFSEALDGAKRRLYVTSRDVDAEVTHGFVLRRLNERLDEGVQVSIDTSVTLSPAPRGDRGSFEPGVELWLSSRQKPWLTLRQRDAAHGDLYILIKDDDLAIVTNRPFLCGRQRPAAFVPTVGVVTRRPEIVEAIGRLARIGSAETPGGGLAPGG